MRNLFFSLLLLPSLSFGSSFGEVWSQVKSDPYKSMPMHPVTRASFFQGAVDLLKASANRTLNDRSDLLPRFQKLVHPVGICFAGSWNITESSPYSGYFESGKRALIIVRASEAMGQPLAGNYRSFGFAGKIFPTDNPKDTTSVTTANFFTVDDLGGTMSESFLGLAKTNEPKTSVHLNAIFSAPTLLKIVQTFTAADSNPGFRPVTDIARLGVSANQTVRSPRLLAIRPETSPTVRTSDFRNELRLANYQGPLRFGIYVSEKGDQWTRLGQIVLSEEALSDSCDHRLHFHHPRLK